MPGYIKPVFHFHVRRSYQLTRSIVSPGVVSTGETFSRTLVIRDQACKAVRTGINKSLDLCIRLAYDEYWHLGNLVGQEITTGWYFIFPPDTYPFLLENGLAFVVKKLERMINRRRYRVCLVER